MSSGDLTTLANVKAYAQVTSTTDDAVLTRMITSLSTMVQTYLNRQIASQSYTDTIDGAGGYRLQFANYPVTAVSIVTVDGISIPAASLPAVSGWTGYVFTPTQIALQGYCFTRGYSNVILNYTAGFASTPADIEEAVIELIAMRYMERTRIGQNSKSIAGETISFNIKDFPATTQTILTNYRRVAPYV